jgi:hypothetical protein
METQGDVALALSMFMVFYGFRAGSQRREP